MADFSAVSFEGKSYKEINLNNVPEGYFSVHKNIGYTPLQVLEEIQLQISEKLTMTYVGRLDPMAEGWFDILFSGNLELKDRLMVKDKTYEVGVLFGLATDTGDILGKIVNTGTSEITEENLKKTLEKFVGKFTWDYPAYSSPMLGKVDEVRQKEIEIYSIEFLKMEKLSGEEVSGKIVEKLNLSQMPGDFRLEEIVKQWKEAEFKNNEYSVANIKVHCSSGTYMRTLAEKIGNDLGTVALAFSIKRS